MKKLMRKLSRVADSSQYSLLRSKTTSSTFSSSFRRLSRRTEVSSSSSFRVPEGHLPVYVGEEMERFVVSAELLNHPIFVKLLNKSAQEYGYEQKGVLRIPCHVLVFERVLEALRLGEDLSSPDLEDLFNSLNASDEIQFFEN